MIIDIAILLSISIGLGFFFPSPFADGRPTPGYRAFCGFCLKMFLVYLGVVLLGIGFDATLAILMITATIGLVIGLRRMQLAGQSFEFLYHPLIILPLFITAVRLGYGPIEFAPYGDDTYANWLRHSKQIWLINDFWSDSVHTSAKGYPPGWHMLLPLTSSLWGNYSDSHVIAVPTVLHITLISLVFDVVVIWWRDELNRPSKSSKILGYTFVLFALAIEASWKLVPTLILSEPPLFLTLIGSIVMGFFFWFQDTRFYQLAGSIGIALSAHFLVKDQGLVLIPTVACLIICASFSQLKGTSQFRQSLIGLVIALLPVLIVISSWKALGPHSPKCAADTGNLLSKGIANFFASNAWRTLAADLINNVVAYISTYKLPLTILAGAGLISGGFFARVRWISFSVAVYVIFYIGAVYWAYLSCPDGFNSYLSSLPRYLQLPVRAFHYIGLMLCAYTAVNILVDHWHRRPFRHTFSALLIVTLFLSTYQVHAVKRSFDIISKPEIGARMSRYISEIPVDIARIKKLVRERGLRYPKVLVSYVFWSNFPFNVALHHAYPSHRDNLPDNEKLAELDLISARFNDASQNWPVVLSTRIQLEDLDIIWAIDHSSSLTKRISDLVLDQNCLKNVTAYYLIKTSENKFSCVLRQPLRLR